MYTPTAHDGSVENTNEIISHATDAVYLPVCDEKRRKQQSTQELERHSDPSIAPSNAPVEYLRYTVTLKKSAMDFKTINIFPESPSLELQSWQLVYSTSHEAAMHRLVPGTNEKATSRNIATIKFPKVIWPGYGPTITFKPHEAEIKKRGLRHVSLTDRFMACTGWLSTTYGIDMPALNGARVEWKVSTKREPEYATTEISPPMKPPKAFDEKLSNSVTLNEIDDATTASTYRDNWTPFPTQVLTREMSDDILATYTRSAPWAKRSGLLAIPRSTSPSEHLFEDIVIICAAMIGMQDRSGLTSALIESACDHLSGGKVQS